MDNREASELAQQSKQDTRALNMNISEPTPVDIAFLEGHWDEVERFFEQENSDMEFKSTTIRTPDHLCDKYWLNYNRSIYVHKALKERKWDVVRCLVKKGADIHHKDAVYEENRTPLSTTIRWNDDTPEDIFPLLMTAESVNSQDFPGNTALHYCMEKHMRLFDVAGKLIDNGADVNIVNKRDMTPLEWAFWYSLKSEVAIPYLEKFLPDDRVRLYRIIVAMVSMDYYNDRIEQPYFLATLKWLIQHCPKLTFTLDISTALKVATDDTFISALPLQTVAQTWLIAYTLDKLGIVKYVGEKFQDEPQDDDEDVITDYQRKFGIAIDEMFPMQYDVITKEGGFQKKVDKICIYNPSSLLTICDTFVKNHMRFHDDKNYEQLGLPRQLEDCLKRHHIAEDLYRKCLILHEDKIAEGHMICDERYCVSGCKHVIVDNMIRFLGN